MKLVSTGSNYLAMIVDCAQTLLLTYSEKKKFLKKKQKANAFKKILGSFLLTPPPPPICGNKNLNTFPFYPYAEANSSLIG